jgi:hypothetical protein
MGEGDHSEADRFALDDFTAERLVAGLLAPDDAPPGYRSVAVLIAAARAPGTAEELAGEAEATAAFAETAAAWTQTTGSKRHPGRAVAAGVIAALVLGAGASVAAATNSLPSSLQHMASVAFGHLGIDVPDHSGHSSGSSPSTSTTTHPDGHSSTSTPPRCSPQGRCDDNHGGTVCTQHSNDHCRAARDTSTTEPTSTTVPGHQGNGQGNGKGHSSDRSTTTTVAATSTSTTHGNGGGGNGKGNGKGSG